MVSWVDDFIDIVSNSVKNNTPVTFSDDHGNNITMILGQDILNILIQNRARLALLTKQAFVGFLQLMVKQQSFEALVLVYNELDNEMLLDKYKNNADALEKIAKQISEDRIFWIWLAKQIGMKVVFEVLVALLTREKETEDA